MSEEKTMLTPDELRRYSRHISLPNVGLKGQETLKKSSVLLIGAGGLGSPAALYLAAAGVGHLGIVDGDAVDLSNLQRQILHRSSNVGVNKSLSAKEQLSETNPFTNVSCYETYIDEHNAMDIIKEYDLVIDGSDNFSTRYLVNDACALAGKALVYGSIYRFEGQVSLWDAQHGPCYRCLFPEPPAADAIPNCADAGVFGVLPGIIGTLQANEAIKFLLNIGTTLLGRLIIYDALDLSFREIKLAKDPNCPLCGETPRISELKKEHFSCSSIAENENSTRSINVHELQKLMTQNTALNLLDVREDFELELCKLQAATHIPLGQLAQRVDEIDAAKPWVVYCHHGVRSAKACQILSSGGVSEVSNLTGGIHEWAVKIDPEMSQY